MLGLQARLRALEGEVEEALRRVDRLGRGRAIERPGVRQGWAELEADVRAGRLSRSEAGRRLGISRQSVNRLLG